MLLELLHCLTERDGQRTPHIPGRSAPDISRLAGLHALQEVVVLLLLTGLLRPVEVVVFGDGDVEPLVMAGLHVLPRLVLQPDPWEGEGVGDDVVKPGVVEDDSVAEAGVQVEEETISDHVGIDFVRECEGVTHPVVHRVHDAAPQGLRHHGVSGLHVDHRVLDGVSEREGAVLYTGQDLCTVYKITRI